jgi:hypothetical protein
MLLQNAPSWQEQWFNKNRPLINSAKKKGRPIRPGDMEPVYHGVPMDQFKGMKKALGIKESGSFKLWFDFTNVKGLVNMVVIQGEA